MLKQFVLVGLVILFSQARLLSQSTADEVTFAEEIDTLDLKKHLYHLASADLQGRETGSEGQKRAAAYIKNQFIALGLKPLQKFGSMTQPLELIRSSPLTPQLIIDGEKLRYDIDFTFQGEWNMPAWRTNEIVFAGKASSEILSELEVKNKVVAFVRDGANSTNQLNRIWEYGAETAIMILPKQPISDYLSGPGTVHRQSYMRIGENGKFASRFFLMDGKVADRLFSANLREISESNSVEAINRAALTLPTRYHVARKTSIVHTENVLGMIEGTEKPDEIVVVTAHYDHLGESGTDIFHGADDNASGTSAILEIAEAMAIAKAAGKGPKRSVLFMAMTGEEEGNLGSQLFMKKLPFDKSRIVADLNVDGIGRIAHEYADYEDYIYLIGSDKLSSELHQLSEEANASYTKLDLDYTYNAEDHPDQIYYRSDHWSFAREGIPVIFYWGGFNDDYHQPSDTADKINYESLAKRSQLIFHTAWAIANAPNRLRLDK